MAQVPVKILTIDDDPNVTWIIQESLQEHGYQVELVNDPLQCMDRVREFLPEICLLDIHMPELSGLELLKLIKDFDENITVVMISGQADTQNVVRAMQGGAEDFIVKPFDIEMVNICVRRVVDKKALQRQVEDLRSKLQEQSEWGQFIGESHEIQEIKERVEQVAPTDLNVLIRGESGTGKDVLARLIHNRSDRRKGPFIKVNCAALPGELLESELFGFEKGAFTGAHRAKPGRFELAENGTIFLDEIGEIPFPLQAKLLQALEHKEFFRVGGTMTIKVDVRLVCATNIDFEKAVADKQFRMDLFYRLNEVTLRLPALREHKDDIPLLCRHFLELYCAKYNKLIDRLPDELMSKMLEYNWLGNVRELEGLVKRFVIFGSDEIDKTLEGAAGEAPAAAAAANDEVMQELLNLTNFVNTSLCLKDATEKVVSLVESKVIRRALEQTSWNRKKAAKLLDISYRSLLYKIQDYRLE